MIKLTERAAAGLREMLTETRAPRDQGVKLVPTESGGMAMVIDRAADGDDVVDGGNRPLLIVDSGLTSRLEGVVIDVASGDKGEGDKAEEQRPKFVLRWPEAH